MGDNKAMRWLFRFKIEEDETWANYCIRAARVARKKWRKMKLPFLETLSEYCTRTSEIAMKIWEKMK